MTIGQRLLKTSCKALEDLAEAEFSSAKILEACHVAAAKGFTRCEIKPTIPVDVSGTEAFSLVLKELKREWLELAWFTRSIPGEPTYKILEICWDKRQR